MNLRYGVLDPLSRTGTETDTCTACAGTMILEFAALSRLSGESVFEVLSSGIIVYITKGTLKLVNALFLRLCIDTVTSKLVSYPHQEHARKALDVLWERRQRGSNLVGTVINIHNGDWVRRGEPRCFTCLTSS